ncbi:Histidinol-phosphate aminotransferase, partial [Tolypocladium paradoxum]
RARVVAQRERLLRELPAVEGVGRLRGGTESNFLLFEMLDARGRPDNAVALAVYQRLAETQGVVVRFRGNEHGCSGCLRITVGTEDEVTRFLDALRTQLPKVRGAGAGAVNGAVEEKEGNDANGVVA